MWGAKLLVSFQYLRKETINTDIITIQTTNICLLSTIMAKFGALNTHYFI